MTSSRDVSGVDSSKCIGTETGLVKAHEFGGVLINPLFTPHMMFISFT